MKLRKDKFLFSLHSEEFKWISIPLLILFIISLSAFIATSFWKVDLKSAEVFSQGMNYEGMLYWTQYYSASGNTELIVVLIILIMIIIETLYLCKKEHKKLTTKYEGWTLKLIYILIAIVWLVFNIYQAIAFNWEDKGFGPGFDNEVLGSFKYKQVGKSVGIVIQTTILFISCWYIHFKLTKKKDFWFQQYWLDATKGIVFFAFTYIIVAVLKWFFGRVYYYNYDFGNLLNQLSKTNNKAYETYIQSGNIKFPWGFGTNHNLNSPDPTPWWKPDGYFIRPKTSPQFALPINYAFPSGHVNATYCVATVFYLLINPKKGRKLNWWKKIILIWYIIHLLSMNFAVVIMRWHWFSDTSFTNMLAAISFPLCSLITIKSYQSINRRIKIHKQKNVA